MEKKINKNNTKLKNEKFMEFEKILNNAVNENKINHWSIQTYILKKKNLYLNKNGEVESNLGSKRHEFIVTIFKEFEEEMGENSFTLNESITIKDFKRELEDSIFIAGTSRSKMYKFPKADDKILDDSHINYDNLYNKELWNNFEEYDFETFIKDKLSKLEKYMKDTSDDKIKLTINYSEFFNSISENLVKFSNGIEKTKKNNSAYFEFVLTAINLETKEEKEHVVYEDLNNPLTFDFDNFFKKHIQYAKDILIANKAQDFQGKVILSDFAGYDFFMPSGATTPITSFASARLKHMNISTYEIGNKVVNSKLDKLTIYSNPLLKENSKAAPYDALGISGKKLCLIKDSVFTNYLASKKYADYMNVEPSGPVGLFEIEPGNKTEAELYDDQDEIIEIVSFGWFVPDQITGDFSSEIRLGYRIRDGKKTPFKGGLFSGNVFKILEEVELSKEQIHIPMYLGPRTLKFHKGKIVGM